MNGFFIPVFDENGMIQGLSIHLDKPFKNTSELWFSSTNKINGTTAKSWIMRSNITENTTSIYLTDNFLIGNLLKEAKNVPVLAFQNITNSYMILKEIENTNIRSIIFVIRIPECRENLDYIISRVFRDLIPLGYNLETKYIRSCKDFFEEDFNVTYTLNKVA